MSVCFLAANVTEEGQLKKQPKKKQQPEVIL